MSSSDWWLPDLAPSLEQGDIIRTRFNAQIVAPAKYLVRGGTSKRQKQLWEEISEVPEATNEENVRVLATISGEYAIVLSYGCEIDKPNKPVLLAPVFPISKIKGNHEMVVAQKVPRYLPLVDVPNIGLAFANLSRTFSLQQSLITRDDRVMSMTPAGILRVQAQLIAFFSRMLFTDDELATKAE
jgi:hypothetical protein